LSDGRGTSELLRRARVGLCLDCRHARALTSARGSEFWLCGRGANEKEYPKYPPLPVLRCRGWERRDDPLARE